MKHLINLLKSGFYIIGIFVSILFCSCKSYFKIVSAPVTNNIVKAASLDSLKNKDREFIIRNGNSAFYVRSLSINGNENSIECTLDKLAVAHRRYVDWGIGGKKTYKGRYSIDAAVLNEVHIYTEPNNLMALGYNKIYLDKIQKIEIVEKDKGRTTASHIMGTIGLSVGILALIVTLVLLSNPFSF